MREQLAKTGRRAWPSVIGGAAALLAIAGAAGCGSSATTDSAKPGSAGADAAVTTTVTATATPAPALTEAPATEVAAAAAPAPAPEPVMMPNVVCMNLQAAQDSIQEAGVFFSRSADASGAGRNQVIDSNWIVVGQTPSAGEPVGEGEAVLSAVKIGEPSPC